MYWIDEVIEKYDDAYFVTMTQVREHTSMSGTYETPEDCNAFNLKCFSGDPVDAEPEDQVGGEVVRAVEGQVRRPRGEELQRETQTPTIITCKPILVSPPSPDSLDAVLLRIPIESEP